MFPLGSIMYEGMGLTFNQTHQPLYVPWCLWRWLFRLMLVASKLVFEESLIYSLFIFWKFEALRLMLWILDLWLTNSLLDDWWLMNDVIWYYDLFHVLMLSITNSTFYMHLLTYMHQNIYKIKTLPNRKLSKVSLFAPAPASAPK